MITAALLIAAPLLQEPVPELSPAQKYFAVIEAKLDKAPALHLTATADMSMAMGEELMPMGTLNFDIHFARPLNGWGEVSGEINFMGMQEERSQGLLLDGKKIWAADHKQQSLMEIGSDLAELGQDMPGLDFAAWWMGQKPSADSLSLISDEKEHPGLTGLQIDDFEMTTVTWFNEKGIPQSSEVTPNEGGMTPSFSVTYNSVELPAKIKLEEYKVEMPEDYTVITIEEMMAETGYTDGMDEDSLEDSLLSVGADAPDVTFIGMDDVEVKLSAYRGKTVLLNFWFYH